MSSIQQEIFPSRHSASALPVSAMMVEMIQCMLRSATALPTSHWEVNVQGLVWQGMNMGGDDGEQLQCTLHRAKARPSSLLRLGEK